MKEALIVTVAERYVPVVQLVEHNGDCGPGKPYVPIDVDALFGEPTVALRGPWSGANLVKIGPTAKDLAGGLFQYHLDFPGDALHPGCSYLHWERRTTAGAAPTAYAHVVTDPDHPGRLVALTTAYAYFDDRVRTELAGEGAPAQLPAKISLSGRTA